MSPEELENLNKRYNKALQKLNAEKGSINASIADSNKKINQLRVDKDVINSNVNNYKDLIAKAKDAKSKNVELFDGMKVDDAIRLYENKVKDAQEKVNGINEQIEDIKEDAQRQQTNLDFLQKRVDARVNAVKENPEIKKQINEALGKNYQRKIKKNVKEKEEVKEKTSRISNIQNTLKTHPDGGKHAGELIVNLMKVDTEPISEYKRIAKIRDMKSKQGQDTRLEDSKLAQLKPKFDAAKQQVKNGLKEISSYKGLDINMDDIELLKENASKDQKGEINLQGTLNRTTKRLNKQIKGIDKSIENHQIALENLGIQRVDTEKILNPEKENDNSERTEEGKQKKDLPDADVYRNKKARPMGRLKRFWENIKRIFGGSKNTALPEGHSDVENDENIDNTTSENNNGNKNEKDNDFKNSLKYNVVRDVMNEQRKEDLKNANLQRKIQNTAQKETKKDDDELNR